MNGIRRMFRRSAWLALVAMLGLALAPAVSHALATRAVNAQPWSELCSVDGDSDAGAVLAHCPLCSQAGHTPALPGGPVTAGTPTQTRGVAPADVPSGVFVAAAWVAPPSRAPPPALA